MKKNTFIQGAFIATFAIILTKIIGVLYVIPFYPLIGEQGGALYGYAYTIYSLFLNLSIAGIPFAISRITSEYNSLNQYYLKEKAYNIGKIFICALGFLGFLILFFFSENIAFLFIRNIEGGNSIEDVSSVIKVVSTALLIVPLLSVSKGYLQGQKYITAPSTSQVIEQISRVAFLLLGSFLAIRVFNLSLTTAVGFAVFGATFGALIAYSYIFTKIKQNRKNLNRDFEETEEEKQVKTKDIIFKILKFSIPFILIDLVRSGYNFVDLMTINQAMVNIGYDIKEAESVIAILSTWGVKLNSILFAISTGIVVSLIPSLTSSFVKKDKEEVKRKINKALQTLIYLILPLTVMLSFLAEPVWNVFFGSNSEIGPIVFTYSIYVAFVICLFNTTVSVLNSLSEAKKVVLSLIIGLIVKAVLNVPLINLMHSLGIYPAYGITTATILGFLTCFLLNLYHMKKILKIEYKETIIKFLKMLTSTLIMVLVLFTISLFLTKNSDSRIISLLICVFYSLVGAIIYLYITAKIKVTQEIFGDDIFHRIKLKILKIYKKIKLW